MDRESLLHYLRALGVQLDTRQSNAKKIVGYCPLARWRHKSGRDKRPSFAAFVNEDGISGYKCLACHSKGTIRKLTNEISRFSGEDLTDILDDINLTEEYALTYVPDYEESLMLKAESGIPEPLDEVMYEGIYPPCRDFPEAISYLSDRRISLETCERLGVCYDPEDRRIIFPVYRRGDKGPELYGFTGRSINPEHTIKVKDYYGLPKKYLILGEHSWVVGRPLIIVEGLFGYLSLHEQGVGDYVNIGAILGSHLTDQKADTLIEFGEDTYLLYDNDAGGDIGLFGDEHEDGFKGAIKMLEGFIPIYVPAWPEGKDDPDQLSLSEVLTILKDTPPYFS